MCKIIYFYLCKQIDGMVKRYLHILLLTVCTALGCGAQPKSTVYEPVCYEDGTPVKDDPEAKALFAKDRFLADTTVTQRNDTIIVYSHSSAYIRLQLDKMPTGAGIDQITLVPMEGDPTVLPVTIPESGSLVLWMPRKPQKVPATAVIVQAKDGRVWSVRLPALKLKAGVAYQWTGTVLTPTPPAPRISARALSSTSLSEVEPGEHSGITWLSGNRYAVVDDNKKGGGILHFTIPIDDDGYVGTVSMRPAAETANAKGATRDCEGIAYVPSLGTLYVASEKHQEIREYDLAGRETGKALQVPKDLSASAITHNRGFEALTFNDATGLFWTTTEAPLPKDTFLPGILRLQSFTVDGKPAERFFYQTGEPEKSANNAAAYVFGVPTLAALDDGRVLVLEREVYVPNGKLWDKLQKSFTRMDLYIVDPVHDTAGILRKALLCSFRTGAMDLANFEGMCLGPTLPDGRRCLIMIADSQKGAGGLTSEYVKVILLK